MALYQYKEFNEDFIEKIHGRLYFYRKLYQGKHTEIFERAQKLIESGEIIDNLLNKSIETQFNKSPYIVANISKLIVNVPATLVARSIGKIDTSLDADSVAAEAANSETDDQLEEGQGGVNEEILNLQQELIRQIVLNSKLDSQHRMNVAQHQIDGGLVGVPWLDDRGLRIEFKARDVYFPHEDDLGADLSYSRTFDEVEYLHIYRERVYQAGEKEEDGEFVAPEEGLRAEHILYELGKGGVVTDSRVDPDKAAELLGMEVDELEQFYPTRTRLFIRYWANEQTFMDPLGVSALVGQEGKQDEINWALTRNAFVFERNGKPRIAINKELANALQKNMIKIYGEGARGKFDSKQLEIFTMDENGKSMEIFQIDISKIGDVAWVKDLIKLMLMETQTSEKAIDFYMSESGGAAQSGIAKFYDLFLSLMKAEQLQHEYIAFLKGLIEDALWLQNKQDPAVRIEEPEIGLKEMIPIQRKEVIEENMMLHAAANGKTAQSLETTLRKINPHWSEDKIQEELLSIEVEKMSADSTSLGATGAQTVANFLDNPNNRPAAADPEQ